MLSRLFKLTLLGLTMPAVLGAQRAIGAADPRLGATQKPPLHARHWLAITGKPLSASAGAQIFAGGGNAVDAAAAMLAAGCTMWDTLGCGGETQALIYNPNTKKVIGVNALGVAPTGATAAFYRSKKYEYPPEYGPLAAVTPGTVGGLLTMLAEWGTMSLKDVLAPAIQMADGYAIEAQLVRSITRDKQWITQWKYSPAVFLPNDGNPPEPGQVFVQKDLAATWRKLVEAEQQALAAGKTRKQAIYAAYDRFYKGDIAQEIVRGVREDGGLFTLADLANWKVKIEEPLATTYKGITVYKLQQWQQGPAMLQALNILENADVKAMGYNSPKYIHALYQTMNLAFADRDFYYGDPAFPPVSPMKGLLSKEYARQRFAQIDWSKNDAGAKPGDPYPFEATGAVNPFANILATWDPANFAPKNATRSGSQDRPPVDTAFYEGFHAGTTSIEAADEKGWVVSVTPSGGWVPAVIAGRTGVGLSQRAQSFVTDAKDGPFNVIEPGKRPRVTLTPTLALKDGAPYLAMAVQGGDTQDQNLLQFFLNVVEFGMTVQQAVEAPNINSFQMRSTFGQHEARPGAMEVATSLPESTRVALRGMGYSLQFVERSSGPINAILFDWKHRTMWGGSSNHGEDYGIAW
ncbi:MAG TPA: gamma-glutamyltransferase [Vicinamibacterales bacterium]|jgi:gamma-glutamyltranspeptidase/glutathione hydrolase